MSKDFEILRKASADFGETNDCTVKALSVTTGRTYQDCHNALRMAGRKRRRGASMKIMQEAAEALGYYFERRHSPISAKTVTSAERDPALSSGNIVLLTRGHVAGMSDGKVIDWTKGRRHRIKAVFDVTPMRHMIEPDTTETAKPARPFQGAPTGSQITLF